MSAADSPAPSRTTPGPSAEDAGRAEDADRAVDEHRAVEAAEKAAAVMTAAGMARMPARVLMALVAAPADGYTAAQLAERLGVSAAAISGAVTYLHRLHFIERLSRPGTRVVQYAVVRETFYGSITSNAPIYARMAAFIDEIAAAHSGDAAASARATEMADFFRFLAERFPQLIDEWRQRQG
ncbi:GbsR/MarR family transcriptional regulator [Microbacterium nymphoidis]|uniref:GbsR/MarR family transcriptional regulator n=1 Tax=Microbacterium nymphoidis TaxID=2898586 RepID=UPI001E5952D9|nr:helix-turn-helix domain-containing protein [Microbacterium nymphoidis]MCD2497994.1 MarR family transcriptional regulator [Microbacterium nymphoidis]